MGSAKEGVGRPLKVAGRYRRKINDSSSYGGSFSIFSYACASQFYDAFFFYHKAFTK